VYVPPPATKPPADVVVTLPDMGRDVRDKLKPYCAENTRYVILESEGNQLSPDLDQLLLDGAESNMNEVLFYHRPTKSLLTGDGWYSGGELIKEMNPYFRVFLKQHRGGWKQPKVCLYRYCSVTDQEKFLASLKRIVTEWDFEQILSAHGCIPYRPLDKNVSCKNAFYFHWYDLLLRGQAKQAEAVADKNKEQPCC